MKKSLLILSVILIIAFLIRFVPFSGEFYWEDSLYHNSIVKQSLQNNKLSNINKLNSCSNITSVSHPLGYYFSNYHIAKLVGLENSFKLTPIIFGLISLIIFYLLIKKLFNKNIALLSTLLLTISLSNISKSASHTFRGDNLTYSFLLLSLLFLYKFLTKKNKIIFLILSVISSSITALMWNGYILIVIITIFSLLIYFFYNFIKKQTTKIKFPITFLILQFLLTFILSSISLKTTDKGYIFSHTYYPIILTFSIILVIFLSRKIPYKYHKLSIIFVIILALIFTTIKKDFILNLLYGLNAVKQQIPLKELTMTSLYEYFYYFNFVLITSILGIILYMKDLNNKKIFFLGLLIPSLYLIIMANRYIFFASFSIMVLSGIFLDNFLKKPKKINKIIVIVFIVLILVTNIIIISKLDLNINKDFIQASYYLKEGTPKNTCIITTLENTNRLIYFSERHSYIHPLSYAYDRNMIQIWTFFLTNATASSDIKNTYFLIEEKDIQNSLNWIPIVKIPELGGLFYLKLIKIEENKIIYQDSLTKSIITLEVIDKNLTAYFNEELINKIYYSNTNIYINNTKTNDCLYIGHENIFYFNKQYCNTNLVKMLTWQDINGLQKFYRNNTTRIYKITNVL